MFKPSFLSDEYLVCDKGYVLSKTGKQLKPSINHHGYQKVLQRILLAILNILMATSCGFESHQ